MSLLLPIDPVTYLKELSGAADAHIAVWTDGTDGIPDEFHAQPVILLQFGSALARPLYPRIGEHALYFDGMSFNKTPRTVRIPWDNIMHLLLGDTRNPYFFVRFKTAPPTAVKEPEPKKRGGFQVIDGGKS